MDCCWAAFLSTAGNWNVNPLECSVIGIQRPLSKKKKYLQSAQVDKGQAIRCNLTAITIKASNGRTSFYRTPVFASAAAAIDGFHIMT